MATCPKCKEVWLWDWNQDEYRYTDGSFVKESTKEPWKDTEGHEIEMYQCKCGCINSVIITCETTGTGPVNRPEWENVDWELDENSWNPDK